MGVEGVQQWCTVDGVRWMEQGLYSGNGWLTLVWLTSNPLVGNKTNTFHWRILVDYASVRCKGLDPDLDIGLELRERERERERESIGEQ